MATKFYRSGNAYLGGYDGAVPPAGAIEVPFPPVDARYLWDGAQWAVPEEIKGQLIDEKRRLEYDKRGVTIDALVVALADKEAGKAEALDALQAIREQVKLDIPKESEDVKP